MKGLLHRLSSLCNSPVFFVGRVPQRWNIRKARYPECGIGLAGWRQLRCRQRVERLMPSFLAARV